MPNRMYFPMSNSSDHKFTLVGIQSIRTLCPLFSFSIRLTFIVGPPNLSHFLCKLRKMSSALGCNSEYLFPDLFIFIMVVGVRNEKRMHGCGRSTKKSCQVVTPFQDF